MHLFGSLVPEAALWFEALWKSLIVVALIEIAQKELTLHLLELPELLR